MDGTGSHSRTVEYFDNTSILLALKFQVLLSQLLVCISVTWLINFFFLGGGVVRRRQNRPQVLGVKARCQVRKRGKIGLNQSRIYIHQFLSLPPQFFYLPLFDSVTRKISYVEKKLRGATFPPIAPPPSNYVYDCL